ncbi:MAG TPA: hypothetical protein VG602_03040 [Actinomycetota bacterium]|nr:hypothetical protein [Actinomycetota bacterium]
MPARPVQAVVALILLVGCSQAAAPEELRYPTDFSAADLARIVLQPGEAPPGTDFVEQSSGPFALEEFWPSTCCPVQQEAFGDAGFSSAYGTIFEKPGHSGDPIDARPGVEVASSQAALFLDDAGASEAMLAWIDYHAAPELGPAPTEGLGEESAGFVGNPNAPAETLILYFWRIGPLVLNLRVSGGAGSIGVDDVRALADRMNARAAEA